MKKKHHRLHASGAVSQMIAAMSSAYEPEPCNTCGNCTLMKYETVIRCDACGHEEAASPVQMH
ncbi:MAG: hypothetical protein KBD06_01940 [Candidatus Pacebacteria bacterium]|nr:hypothetical protein [Candidatus Paceibacterota bacterium]